MICKELFLENNGAASQRTEKLICGQTEITDISLMNFQDLGSYRQACCTVELIYIPLSKSVSSPILYFVWQRWETILLNPEKSNSMIFENNLFQRIESNWWKNCGIRVEDFPGFITVRILSQIQQMMGELQCETENFTGARNLLLQIRRILGSNCRENAAQLRRIRSSYIPWYQCLGERRIKK